MNNMIDAGTSYNKRLVYVVGTIAALAGLLFGIDIGVISGALKFIAADFALTTQQQEIVVSSLLVGAVIGTLLSNPLSHHFGRRHTILLSAVIFAVGSLLCAVAPNFYVLVILRVLLGTAVGMASFTAPIYLSEVAPKKIRGRLISLYQLMITIGILLAIISDTYFSYTGNWRAMLGVIFIPAAIMFFGVLTLPRSPRWLMLKGRKEQAKSVLDKILVDDKEVEREMREIEENLARTQEGWKVFKKPYFRRVLSLGIMLQFIQIMTGMNTMMYYAPKIFELAGFATTAQQMWGAVALTTLNVLTTFIALAVIDRWGRRPLLFFGLIFMTIGMGFLGLSFHYGPSTALLKDIAVAGMLIFIFGFAVSLGPVIWVLCAEIFPLKSRDIGVMFTTATNWICCAIIGGFFLSLLNWIGPSDTFWLLAVICVISIVLISIFSPETKDVPLEIIEKNLIDGKRLADIGQ